MFLEHFCNEIYSSLLNNKLDVSGGWLRCIQCVWIWLTAFKALSMLFVLMTSLSLSAVVSCHTCSTSSRLCFCSFQVHVCMCVFPSVCLHSAYRQCLFTTSDGKAQWCTVTCAHKLQHTLTRYLCWQGKLYEELLRQLVHWAEAFLLFILFINSFLKRKN